MSRDDLWTALVCVLLVAAGALAWLVQMRPAPVVDASPLESLPLRIGAWTGHEIPLESSVEAILRADYNVQRAYTRPGDDVVWVYVGYYGTGRGGRPEHTPRGCYTGAGWRVEETRRVVLDPERGLTANEFVVEREGERRLVVFWYRSHRRTGMVGGLDQNLDRLAGRILDGRADGALVRVSTPLRGGDLEAARARIYPFAAALDAELAARWPRELPPTPDLRTAAQSPGAGPVTAP